MSKLYINPKNKKGHINPEIQGHFSEHLGRCIYEGIFVGKDSSIPNVNGMRTDVVEALKDIQIPVLRWPGGCFADEYHWKDGMSSWSFAGSLAVRTTSTAMSEAERFRR